MNLVPLQLKQTYEVKYSLRKDPLICDLFVFSSLGFLVYKLGSTENGKGQLLYRKQTNTLWSSFECKAE